MNNEMPNNIIPFTGITKLDLNAARMLRNIADEEPEFAFVVCWPKDGSMPTYHSNTGDAPVVLYQLQKFIHKELAGDFA